MGIISVLLMRILIGFHMMRISMTDRCWLAVGGMPSTLPSSFRGCGLTVSITFEKTPSDYAILKIHTLPETGGGTARIAQTKG